MKKPFDPTKSGIYDAYREPSKAAAIVGGIIVIILFVVILWILLEWSYKR